MQLIDLLLERLEFLQTLGALFDVIFGGLDQMLDFFIFNRFTDD